MFKDYLTRKIEGVLANSTTIRKIQATLRIMGQNQTDIDTKVQELNDAFDGFATELETEVTALKNQIAANPSVPITPDDLSGLDALLAKIQAATAKDNPTPAPDADPTAS